ncbi:hypothetical protein [Mastigocoleus testarum]|uniref:Uncharacterized protein n=1 Tax=Mastigocoleus testarum BC008 TaxID=371196 RepID=A0A0V7ZZG2_9CYAN|nr:hypothetical protein [Mastigocoleus testarum]KST69835.1 hypothetical protein BC008_36370 [Mastigocoleus testarum BC008]
MTDNKTRRNFLIGSVAVPGSIAAAAALTQESSNAETPTTEAEVTAVGTNIDADRLSRFKLEVQEKAIETLDYSPLFKMLGEYGFPDRVVKIQVKIMLNEMKTTLNKDIKQQKPTMKDPELENSLMAIAAEEIVVQDCLLCFPFSSCG